MPLETIGNLAVAGSSGAPAREARTVTISNSSDAAADGTFAALSARGGDAGSAVSGGNVIAIPSPAPNVAAYLSPFIRFDLRTRLAIVEFRDSQTGEVKRQYPSPRVVREYEQNLPEDSELRPADSEPGAQRLKPHIVGSADIGTDTGDTRIVNFGVGRPSNGVDGTARDSGAQPSVSALARTAIAAFNSAAGTAASTSDSSSGRQVAIA